MARPLNEQVVVVTGASSGIGRQTALRFAEAGARVVIAARRGELLESLAQELEDGGHTVLPIVADVTDRLQVEALVEAAIARFEWIDSWVNNAGAAVFGPFDQIPPEDFAREIDVTLMSQVNATRAILPVLRRQGRGTIINVGSLFGRVPLPLYSAYVAAEFGLVGFTECLRQELQGTGVDICMVAPGWVDTPFFDHARGASGLKPRPVGPVYSPDTVAETILECAIRPRSAVTVGWATRSVVLADRFFPSLVRARLSRLSQRMLDTDSPMPYVDALYAPSVEGRQARGGWGSTREHLKASLQRNGRWLSFGMGAVAAGVGLLAFRRFQGSR